jgi:hypothetical protein
LYFVKIKFETSSLRSRRRRDDDVDDEEEEEENKIKKNLFLSFRFSAH